MRMTETPAGEGQSDWWDLLFLSYTSHISFKISTLEKSRPDFDLIQTFLEIEIPFNVQLYKVYNVTLRGSRDVVENPSES